MGWNLSNKVEFLLTSMLSDPDSSSSFGDTYSLSLSQESILIQPVPDLFAGLPYTLQSFQHIAEFLPISRDDSQSPDYYRHHIKRNGIHPPRIANAKCPFCFSLQATNNKSWPPNPIRALTPQRQNALNKVLGPSRCTKAHYLMLEPELEDIAFLVRNLQKEVRDGRELYPSYIRSHRDLHERSSLAGKIAKIAKHVL